MGFQTGAYLAYGFQIPDMDPDAIDKGLTGVSVGDVGHLTAGKYDDERTFLVTDCREADLGYAKVVSPQTVTPEQYEAWGTQLRAAATALGLTELPEPGWLLIPSVS